ncbi:fumarylacetoacetate hydrolase family protein [Sphingobium boeckii]|uniref:2-keto-4-pentenoate hydratase/2-oxohepta-3-ene-1,7-dioic acid hydratase in catechol pathway n=1 Tax=Sphingobium boeckii TaxID=1082345 RepID=A0A7W9EEB0_9SPHN|nr:fumarylacetoacetate hydrolase family protein [Sphingobium boeckii]MBB5684815.1 2-keto-4-pentenoate hydratase/2-oxohepta-3-ene-1,7-dioic acid hydratase in catechol pathway [Sphingobium boeckii]
MRIARCADEDSKIFWAAVDPEGQSVRLLSGALNDWAPQFTETRDDSTLPFNGITRPLAGLRLLPPVEKSNKIVVCGANYAKHLMEFGVKPTSQPVAFLKSYGALIGANDAIRYPPTTKQLDHEVELVAVMGTFSLDRANPLASLLGYTVGNDVSARDIQRLGPAGIGLDLFGAKSQDRTCGVGPWIVTLDEFTEQQPRLGLRLRVNGDLRQDGNSGDMTWSIAELLNFVDERSSLEAGDILFTGTPHGVSDATGNFLKRGDLVEAEVEKIGVLRNRVE